MSYDEESMDDRDVARRRLGDITDDDDTELRTDEHYDAMIAEYGLNGAIAEIAADLAAEYAQKPGSVSIPTASGALSVSWADRVKTWLGIAARYRAQAAIEAATTAPSTTARACNRAVW